MTDQQITALAREYAEEECNKSTMIDTSNLYEDKLLEFYDVYGFLLRRFCLVEKENIEKYFQSLNYILTHQDEYEVYIVRESEVEMTLLRCLFPEIASGNEV